MTFFGRFTSWLGAIGSTTQNKGIQDSRPAQTIYPKTKDISIDGALQVSAVWACVELLSDVIASLPIYVYRVNNGVRELARDSGLWMLLHTKPNSRQTPMEFFQYMAMNFIMRGNAYARIQRNSRGEAIALWPLAADQVQVTLLDDGALSYEYYYDGKIIVYGQDSILHLRDKGNGIVGMSRLDYMRATNNLAVNAQNLTNNLYAKDNKRAGVFSIDKTLTKEQREQIRENFRGLTEAGEDLVVLESGAKFDPLTLTPAEVQLLETRRFSIEDIARWFGIPSILINDLTNRVPYGNNDDLIQFFYKFKLRSVLVNFEQAITARVMTFGERSTYTIEFGLDALLRSSLKERMDIYSKAVQNGIYTRNFCRQLENEPPMEGGDTLTAQVNLAPLDMLGKMGGNVSSDAPETVAQ